MDRLTLEEMQRRLAEIPAEQFGCGHKNCAIGQLHYVMTGKRSFGFDGNVYPFDVARAVAVLNDNISPEDRKALAMMLPLPEAFPELTPERAIKLAAWAGEKALGYYDGPGEKALEKAVALARRAVSGEPYTEEEETAAFEAADKVIFPATTSQLFWVTHAMIDTAKTLLRVVLDTRGNISMVEAVCGMASVACHAGIEWRPWMHDYLRIRLEA